MYVCNLGKSRNTEQRQRATKYKGTKEQRNGKTAVFAPDTKLDEKNNPNYLYNQNYLYLCGIIKTE